MNFSKNSTSTKVTSLHVLLDSLGFNSWISVTASFIMPFLGLLGILFCSLSAFIFFRPRFINPIYVYYRVLCLIYIIQLIHGIPLGPILTPRYIPSLNTYLSSFYLIYYSFITHFLFLFADLIQMAILLERLRKSSSFMMRYFKCLNPRFISLIIFFTSFCIGLPQLFAFKIISFGTFYDADTDYKQTNTFYYMTSSDFSSNLVGKILLGFTQLFLNQFLTLTLSITLNVYSVLKFKSYLRQRRRDVEDVEMTSLENCHSQPSADVIINVEPSLSIKEKILRETEKNMFYMAFTLCLISLISRLSLMFCFVWFFLFFHNLNSSLAIGFIVYSISIIEPILNIGVIYAFNPMFRNLFKRKVKEILCIKCFLKI